MGLFRLTTKECVTSTNEEVKRLIEAGEPEGAVVRAYAQSGGYGRQGRSWASPFGGMYQSILLRPEVEPAQISTIALVTGLAVRAALEGILDAGSSCACGEILVKWPNDIVCAAGKLCGISAELHRKALCVGIGVNVFAPQETVEIKGGNTPVYVADLLAGRAEPDDVELDAAQTAARDASTRAFVDEVGDAILVELEARYGRWVREGFPAFADEFRAAMALRGQCVRMEDRSGSILAEGAVTDIDSQGRLVLDTASGLLSVSSGEAHTAH